MSVSPSSSAQAARRRLGEQLRQLRTAVRISGVDFARRAGWASSAMVTMVEKGQKPISADHVRLWCMICGAPELRLAELLAEQANVAGMWLTHQQLGQAGFKARQDRIRGRYDNARLIRAYCTRGIPGLIQTEAYMTAALTAARMEQAVEVDDIAEAVAARLDRQTVLRRPEKRFVFVLEEDVLWHRVTEPDVHREQLERVLTDMHLPAVSLGIIPRTARREVAGYGVWPEETFFITDASEVNVELVSGYLSLKQPAEIAMYVAAFGRLLSLAVHGDRARALINEALATLDDEAVTE